MSIRNDYRLVLNFFEWACQCRDPSLEARCILAQIATASKDLKIARKLIQDFCVNPNLDVGVSFGHFVEQLIYTYKDWGLEPRVFDIFFQVLVEAGMLNEARKLFDKMLNYGLLISVESCNLFISHLSKDLDGIKVASKVFSEFPEVGVCWNTASYNIITHSLC